MASAKQSALDRLHKLFVEELTSQLKGTTDPETGERIPPTAALLTVIGATLYRAGVKPTNDNPSHQKLARAFESLPFMTDDGEKPSTKAN
jgi:hypothetical protein